MFTKTRTLNTEKRSRSIKNRLVLGFAGALSAAVVGTAGIAAAATPAKTMVLPNRATCASQWQRFDFKNRGQCEAFWNKHKHDHDHGMRHGQGNNGGGTSGYGGNVTTGVTVTVNGNNNVVTVILNIFR